MPRNALSLDERVSIQAGIAGGDSNRMIAVELGRHPSTIGEEIERNGGREKYRAVRAERRAVKQRARPKLTKLEQDPVLAAHVESRMEALDSPMTIAIELRRGVYPKLAGSSISHETLYGAHYSGRGLSDKRPRPTPHLRRRRRRCRKPAAQQAGGGSHSLGQFSSIHARPAIALERVEPGHLEGDMIVGAFNRSAMITVFDRASRRLWLSDPVSKNADEVKTVLIELLNTIPAEVRRTLTWDQGSEIAEHRAIASACNIDIYIADKSSPWQRPTNEAGNAFIRRYVGKGTDLYLITPERREWICNRINTTPRRSLNWATANEVYNRLIAMTP